jgi:predicted ester cyclase
VTPIDAEALFAVVDRHNAAEHAGDLAATMDTVGPHPEFHIYPLGLHMTRREQVEAYYRGLYEAGFQNFDADLRNRWAVDAETVVVEVDVTVQIQGEFMGLALQEPRRVMIPQIAILTIRDALVQGERSYFDILSIQKQLTG